MNPQVLVAIDWLDSKIVPKMSPPSAASSNRIGERIVMPPLLQRRPLPPRLLQLALLTISSGPFPKIRCSTTATIGAAHALTVTTFNVLAPVHRSVPLPDGCEGEGVGMAGAIDDVEYCWDDLAEDRRESDRVEWWRPRAEAVARHVAEELRSSDVILLQEWWFNAEFEAIFDSITGHLFERVGERRPSGPAPDAPMREDGMAVLVRRGGRLELLQSRPVRTGPQRIAQLVHCRERRRGGRASGADGRSVFIANAHLSFPGDPDLRVNDRRQAFEAQLVARALSRSPFNAAMPGNSDLEPPLSPAARTATTRLEILGGDFNSNSRGLAARSLEGHPHNFVNCASASSDQVLVSGSGGRINLGVTHRTHRGEDVSVDHIFTRLVKCGGGPATEEKQEQPTIDPVEGWRRRRRRGRCTALQFGYLDAGGTRIVDCTRGDLRLDGKILSDHRHVTATLEWPPYKAHQFSGENPASSLSADDDTDTTGSVDLPLDPLEPPWGVG